MDQSKDVTVTKQTNQKTALLLKIEYGTVIKRTNQKTALLLKIESDTVTKKTDQSEETLKGAKYIRRSEKRFSQS